MPQREVLADWELGEGEVTRAKSRCTSMLMRVCMCVHTGMFT